MKLTTFIKRPILSGVISVLIVLVGVLSLLSLPIEQYPDIAPPTVSVSTSYFGADAQTIINSVITPLEESINGVEHMIYMNSTASNSGDVDISVVFAQGTNPDMATVNVNTRVQKVLSQLPAEVTQMGVSVEKRQNSMLQIFSIYSPDDSYDYSFLTNFAAINVKPVIQRISGIGEFKMFGSEYSMRIWLNPAALAQHNLNPSDVLNVLATQNIEAATGTLGKDSDETYQYAMKYTGRLKSPEAFEDIIIQADNQGNILRLRDIARVELGSEYYNFTGTANGHPGVMCIAYQSAGSNATAVNEEITKALAQIKAEAPSGIDFAILNNTNDFLYASISQVLETLRDAIILVILIVLIFLKDLRSTAIPFISIMVSLIGTFAFMTIAGFSINLLTLFALVLVIGTVVDDSIVVVEAVHAEFEKGILDPYKATKNAVQNVMMPVITSSLVFMAVFIPVSFLGGTTGVFYRQFGLTMAVAVGISALNALTTVPALCALMLKPIRKPVEGQKLTFKQKYARWFDGMFSKFSASYQNSVGKYIGRKPLIWGILLIGLFAFIFFMDRMPKGLVPTEDNGLFIVEMNTPPGTSLRETDRVLNLLAGDIQKIEGVAEVSTTGGYGFTSGASSASGIIIAKLKHWEERGGETSYLNLYKNITAATKKYEQASCMVFSTPMIPGYGTSNGIDMYVQDRRGGSIEELYDVTFNFINDLAKDGINGFMAFTIDFPQWQVSVDVAKCLRSGLTPKDVLNTIGSYYGGSYINNINLYSKVYKVMVQAEADNRRDEFSFDQMSIRTKSGEMAPLSSFVSLKRIYGPESIKTFNKFISINVQASSDMSTGEALAVIEKASKEYLPEGYGIDFAGMSREQNSQGGLGLALILCSFIIYLILAALYESLVIPFAVLLSVPLGLAASFGISWLVGLESNIYVQTGVIMLIGLLSKTAILITEYAVEHHNKGGMETTKASIAAAGDRLRPIIMTAGTMIIGLAPMVLSIGGVGGMGNFSLGLGTIVGMLVGTVGLLFITPVTYTTFQKIQDKIKPAIEDDDEE